MVYNCSIIGFISLFLSSFFSLNAYSNKYYDTNCHMETLVSSRKQNVRPVSNQNTMV